MFNNKVSRKELFTSNPGKILQQQIYRKDLNDSAFHSSENPSDHSSLMMENSQGSYEVYSQRCSQSCSQPSENSSSQKFYRKYMSKAPLFQRDSSYTNERPSSKRPSDYLDHLEVNKQKAKEKDNRDLLNTFVSLVKDCSDEVKTAVEIIKDSVNKNLSDSADQSAMLIDKINEGLSLHYQRLLEAIQSDHKQRLTTSDLREIIATRDAKIELLEFQLETAQKAKDEKVMAFLKEAYDEQKQVTKTQLEQLQKNQQIINEEHIKTLQEQQEMFNKEKKIVESNTECKRCDGVSNESDPIQQVPSTVPMNEVQLEVRDANQQITRTGYAPPSQNVYSMQHNLQQPRSMYTTPLPTAMYHTTNQACWPAQPPHHMQSMHHTLPNRMNQLDSSHQPNGGFYHPQDRGRNAVLPQPLSSSTPLISPIVSASFARWSKESFIKKPSPVATVVPLMKTAIEDTTGRDDIDQNDSIDYNHEQARTYPAMLNVVPTRQSARLCANVDDHYPRLSSLDFYDEDHNENETEQKLLIRRNKRKFKAKEKSEMMSKRKSRPASPQAKNLHPDDVKTTARRRSGKKTQKEVIYVPTEKQPVDIDMKKHFHDRKNSKKRKAKPKRKSIKGKGLPKSLSYSDLNAASRSSNDSWKWKRHSSLTVAEDSSSEDDNILLSFLGENSPPTKLRKIQQGERLISSQIIDKYPDTEDTQQESSQDGAGFPSASPLPRESYKDNQIVRHGVSGRKKKTFEETEQDYSEENDDDDIFSVGDKITQKYILRHDKKNKVSKHKQDVASSRRQLLNISDTNILEISKYIRQQQSRRQDR